MKRAGKRKTDNRQKFVLSEKQLLKEKDEAVREGMTKTAMLYLVALAEKGWDEDQITDLFETTSRYATYVDEKIVSIRQIQDIIERKTGITIKGKW